MASSSKSDAVKSWEKSGKSEMWVNGLDLLGLIEGKEFTEGIIEVTCSNRNYVVFSSRDSVTKHMLLWSRSIEPPHILQFAIITIIYIQFQYIANRLFQFQAFEEPVQKWGESVFSGNWRQESNFPVYLRFVDRWHQRCYKKRCCFNNTCGYCGKLLTFHLMWSKEIGVWMLCGVFCWIRKCMPIYRPWFLTSLPFLMRKHRTG